MFNYYDPPSHNGATSLTRSHQSSRHGKVWLNKKSSINGITFTDSVLYYRLLARSYRRNFVSIVNKLKVILLILIGKVNRRLHFAIAEIIKAYKLEAKKF